MSDHIAYADETQHNTGRYRGIGLVTLSIADVYRVNEDLLRILCESSVSEFKWNKLRTARERFAAIKILKYITDRARDGLLRVDVLTWDIEDSRHKIQRRSDVRNLRRMYYFLFKYVLSERWLDENVWKICPDENSALPWSHLGYFTEITDWNTGNLIAEIKIAEIIPSKSHQEPLIQVADLFAGLAVFSRNSYDTYEKWLCNVSLSGCTPAISLEETMPKFSRSEEERCKVLSLFNEYCKGNRIGVSLKQRRGLRTFNPARPINFWWYEPQTIDDIAPIWH